MKNNADADQPPIWIHTVFKTGEILVQQVSKTWLRIDLPNDRLLVETDDYSLFVQYKKTKKIFPCCWIFFVV